MPPIPALPAAADTALVWGRLRRVSCSAHTPQLRRRETGGEISSLPQFIDGLYGKNLTSTSEVGPTSEVFQESVTISSKMRITTWNVNGLRAAFKNKANQWWEEFDPDVLCLQEVRAQPDQLTKSQQNSFSNKNPIWNPAERPGYSGVATFCKTLPEESITGLGIARFDNEGRVIQSVFPDFRIFNMYVPNGGRDHSRVGFKLDFYQELLEICDQLHQNGEMIILCGDFNTAHQPIDLRNPEDNEGTTGFLPEERVWIDHFLAHNFRDIYRDLYPDREQYTWWTYRFQARQRNIGWRLDYFLISEELVDLVEDVMIHDDVLGSDHCPVTLVLNLDP
jgi:exodeoxyribonuclease-3